MRYLNMETGDLRTEKTLCIGGPPTASQRDFHGAITRKKFSFLIPISCASWKTAALITKIGLYL